MDSGRFAPIRIKKNGFAATRAVDFASRFILSINYKFINYKFMIRTFNDSK
jgi:hypothetical protein